MAPGVRSASKRQNGRGAVRALRGAVKGRKVVPPADPPQFEQIPWNTITLGDNPLLGSDGFKRYTGEDIAGVLKAQIGLNTTTALSMRILDIRVWNVKESENSFINLQVEDFTIGFGAQDYQVHIEDFAGRNRWAKVGYQLPISQQKVIFSSADTEELFTVGGVAGARFVTRIRLLWKTRVTTLPNKEPLQQRVERLEKLLAKVVIADEGSPDGSDDE